MTSVVNGGTTTRNGPPAVCSSSSSNHALLSGSNNNLSSSYSSYPLDNDFNIITNLDFATNSTWDLDPPNWSQEGPRPDSRQSITPVSTPRPPSNPSYSNAPTVVQSSPFTAQPSPNPPTPSNSYVGGGSFHFSPKLEPNFSGDEQQQVQQQQKDNNSSKAEELAIMENSNRLRNLLSKPSDDKNKDKILKDLLNHEDDDHVNNSRSLQSRSAGSSSCDPPKSTSSSIGNDLLRKLLNEKSDEDEQKSRVAGVKRQSELLQQLLRPERDNNVTGGDGVGDSESGQQRDCRQDDSLLISLGFPPSPSNGRKRSNEDSNDQPNKRTSDGSQVSSSGTGTSLRERNKMLASLLAKQPSNPQVIPPMPASVISATPQEKLPRIIPQPEPKNNNTNQIMMNHNAMNNARMVANRMPGRPSQQNTNYLNSVLLANSIQRNDGRQLNQVNTTCYPSPASSTTDNNNSGWGNNLHNMNSTNDPLLSDILDQVIEFVPELHHMLDSVNNLNVDQVRSGAVCLGNSLDANYSELAAISAIQESLMQCESAVAAKGADPPSPIQVSLQQCTPTQVVFSTANNSQFPPPPNYAQSTVQKFQHRPSRMGAVAANQQQFSAASLNSQILHQRKNIQNMHQTQQEHKRRLLNLQKQQQLLIPSNATAANEISQMQNIDSLLNNSVAPNVSLQRSSSVPEPQLSPGYGSQRVSGQQPYSPHSQLASPLGQQNYPQTTVGNYSSARLSPQSQFNAQLSPRQVYPQAVAPSAANWQQAQARVSVQQNPMLSAQLTDNFVVTGGRTFQRSTQQQQQVPQQRSINSPGSARHSPYPADQFPPPTSPNASAFNSQYLRLQRANSVPTATTQLPGALGSPRPYPARDHHHPHPYPSPQLIPPTHNPMMYQQQQDPQYSYDQSSLAYNGSGSGGGDVRGGSGRVVPSPLPQSHLQQGVSTGGTPTSEFVRQELRAVVGARTGQPSAGRTAQQQLLGQQAQSQVNELEDHMMGFEMDYYGGNATR